MTPFKTAFLVFIIICTVIAVPLFLPGCSMSYNGEKLFFKEGCGQCHTYNGKGGMMGPDLSAVTNLRTDSWIDSYIQDPQKMYPFSRMPSFRHLSNSKRKAIISFLKK